MTVPGTKLVKRIGYAQFSIIVVFLITLPLLSWGPGTNVAGGDGQVIYAYVRSVVMDGDLDLENEYRYRWPMVGLYGLIRDQGTDHLITAVDQEQASYKDPDSRTDPNFGLPSALFMERTATGHFANQHAVGPAVLWLPFFLLGHAAAGLLNMVGVPVPLDGFSLPYTIAVGFGTACMVLAALLLTYRILLRYVSAAAAALAVITIYLASPLIVYAIQTPISAHGPAAFTVALFLYLSVPILDSEANTQGQSWPRSLLWGVAAGLMIIVRLESVVLLILVGAALLKDIWIRRQGGSLDLSWLWRYVAFAAGFGIGLLPQLVTGWVIYGAPWITFYPAYDAIGGQSGIVDLTSPHWFDVLWSTNKGLFAWHPILLLATVGLILFWRRQRLLAGALLLALLAQVYIVGSWSWWHGAVSFGQRFFVNFAPVFILGLGWLIAQLQRRVSLHVLAVACVGFSAWNLGLFVQYGIGLIPRDAGFQWADVLYNQFVFIPRLIWHYGGVPGLMVVVGLAAAVIVIAVSLYRSPQPIERARRP
ncbi:MAG: hypothetical protein IT320_02370 [Anaerolineae bacterium]|nr:hypothetical protein [Anaerolineae bacterium]